MSKYNLSDLVKEYIGGGRIGTLKISFKDLQDKMDELENSDKVIVRTLSGPSGDGKVNREFEVVDRDSAVAGGNKQERGFTVYDYKFGFDPGSEEHFMEEYPFSVGGNDLKLAMELIDGVEPYRMEEEKSEKVNEGDLFSSKFDRQELKAIINDLNEQPIFDMSVRRAYKFLVSLLDNEDKAEMGLNEQMYIDDDEFEMEMGRSKKDSLKKEMMIHVDQLIDGNIDMNDFMNVVEEIMAEVKSLKEEIGLNESIPALEKMNNLINALRFHYMQLEKGNIDKDDFINAVEELAFGERRAPGMQEEDAIEDEPVTEIKGDEFLKAAADMAKGFKAFAKDEDKKTKLIKSLIPGTQEILKKSNYADVADEKMVLDFLETHIEDLKDVKNEDDIIDEFEQFYLANTGLSSLDIDENLKEHFKRFI